MASFINKRFSPASTVVAEHVSFVCGLTALNDILSLCMTDGDNDALLLGMPIYGSFVADLQSMSRCVRFLLGWYLAVITEISCSCKLVYAPFGDIDQFSDKAVECYERTLLEAQQSGVKVRALVLANPHNPLGVYAIIW
jgi:hypothetical protein